MEQESKEIVVDRPNSCEISVNAKGIMSGKVKVYKDTIEEAKSKAKAEALELKDFFKLNNE